MAEAADSSPEKRKGGGKERSVEDYKRKIWKLKKELEDQKELALKTQQEKLENLRQVGLCIAYQPHRLKEA